MNRGRGRGRGPSGPRPTARDDDGNALPVEDNQGPPSLYPHVDLPELPTEQELEERDDMIKILSSVNSVFQNSEFYIASDKDVDLENARLALMSSMEMDAGYFPKELWLSMSKRSKSSDVGVQQAKVDRVHPSTIDLSLTRIEELARREGQSTATGAAGAESIMDEKEDAGEDEPEDVYDDDDVFGNDDDPFQQYDDDEEYDDLDDDGGADAYF